MTPLVRLPACPPLSPPPPPSLPSNFSALSHSLPASTPIQVIYSSLPVVKPSFLCVDMNNRSPPAVDDGRLLRVLLLSCLAYKVVVKHIFRLDRHRRRRQTGKAGQHSLVAGLVGWAAPPTTTI